MKLDRLVKKMLSKALFGCLFALSASGAYSGAMGPESINSAGKIYIGAFGGGGAVTRSDIRLYGTAFFSEATGGPLAVDGFGAAQSSSMWMAGGHVGFSWPDNMGLYFPVSPAVELEGYYMGGAKIEGNDFSNDTVRLPEHNFLVSYPLETGVFLVNAVLNSNNTLFGKCGPYVGVGIGSAVVSVSDATAIQLSPPEVGVNHFSETNDKALAFAAQPKVGLHFDLSPHASAFAEYRFLYVSQTNYTFGSTVAPGHVATSPWLGSIKSQHYNMGTVGIDFD